MTTSQRASSPANLLLLSLTYLLYFGQLGVLVPYLGVFLDGRGFSSEQIGELFAIITLTRILGPNLWASLADKRGKGLGILQLGSFLTFVTFCLIFVLDGFWGITLAFALMMMFWTAVLPQLEVLTLNCVQGNATQYSRIRLWGSIGFILLTMLSGKLLDVFSTEAPIYVSAAVLLGIFLASMTLTESSKVAAKDSDNGSIWHQVATRAFLVFIVSAILLQVSFGPFYGFFALYMRDLGYSGEQTGMLVALGVVAEVVIFLLAGGLIGRFGVKWMLLFSTLLTAIRWYLLAAHAAEIYLVLFSQLLHAFSFGMTHAASMDFIHRHFGQRFQSRGQALYISLAFGLGGAVGNYSAGQLWLQGNGAYQTFFAAAMVALVSAALLLFMPGSRQH